MDKFKKLKLTAEKASTVSAPAIAESPISLECKVTEVKPLGTHDMFLAEVVAVHAEDTYMDETGRFLLERANPISYSHGTYYALGEKLGTFGYSVKKKK